MNRLIGLTGQTGAGKTTVAAMFNLKGCFVVDGDILAREIVMPGSPVLGELAARFGADIISSDGSLDRKLLASRAFADEECTRALNSITHPAITCEALRRAEAAFANGYTTAVFDAAALFESGFDSMCCSTVAVIAPADIRLERIMKRDGLTLKQANERINAQQDEQYYLSHADLIIRNFPPYSLEKEFELVYSSLENSERGSGK